MSEPTYPTSEITSSQNAPIPHSTVIGKEFKNNINPLVYGWKRDNEYLYIGMSVIGIIRFYTHNIINVKEEMLITDNIDIWYSTLDDVKKLERQLIGIYNPKYNKIFITKSDKTIECFICKKEFIQSRKWQKYCSDRCANFKRPITYDDPIVKDAVLISIERAQKKQERNLAHKLKISVERLRELGKLAKELENGPYTD